MYFRQAEAPDDPAPPAVRLAGSYDRAGLRNLQQLIQLRWIAVVGQVATILVVQYGLGIALPLQPMFAVLAALVLFNLASHLWCRRHTQVSHAALLVGLLVDVASLTVQLYLSGGIANPFVFLFLLQVVIGTVLLRSPGSWVIAVAAALCVVGLAAVPAPLKLAVEPARGLADHYVQGLLVCFLLIAGLLVVFITRIGGILRERDARLAELRQRAVEEEHIVRIGLLASGAAHELGTPLSTLSVILGDWQHLPTMASDGELHNDVLEMQAQVARCKSIVTNILMAAGETRAEAPTETTLHALFDELAHEWEQARNPPRFDSATRAAPTRVSSPMPAFGRWCSTCWTTRWKLHPTGSPWTCAARTTPWWWWWPMPDLGSSRASCSGWARPTTAARDGRAVAWACSCRSTWPARWAAGCRRRIAPRAVRW